MNKLSIKHNDIFIVYFVKCYCPLAMEHFILTTSKRSCFDIAFNMTIAYLPPTQKGTKLFRKSEQFVPFWFLSKLVKELYYMSKKE